MKLDLVTLVPLRTYTFTDEGESTVGIPIAYRRIFCKGSPKRFGMFQSPSGLILIGQIDENGELTLVKRAKAILEAK